MARQEPTRRRARQVNWTPYPDSFSRETLQANVHPAASQSARLVWRSRLWVMDSFSQAVQTGRGRAAPEKGSLEY